MSRGSCSICESLPPGDLIELDTLAGDPLRWPSTIFEGFTPPVGGLPPSYRRLGAQRLVQRWLKIHGYDGFSVRTVRAHIKYDVPLQVVDVDELVSRGMIALAPDGKKGDRLLGEAIDPLAYIAFYNKGVEIGIRALGLLAQRAEQFLDKKEEVPLPIIKMMADIGTKLAMSQASIRASGKRFGEDSDEDDAFRGTDASPRFKGVRVRNVDGVSRPVADEGLADRTHYNERARQEGGSPIGGR